MGTEYMVRQRSVLRDREGTPLIKSNIRTNGSQFTTIEPSSIYIYIYIYMNIHREQQMQKESNTPRGRV